MSIQKQRKKFSTSFKAKVAIATIKETETMATLSLKYEIHSNQILKWKREFIDNSSMAFEKKNIKKLVSKINQINN